MAKLPFVVEPRVKPIVIKVGSEESGQIEIERRGYLTSGEKAFFQQVKQSDQGTSKLIGLSRKVSRIHGLEMSKAYDAIIRVLSGGAKDETDLKIEEEFAEDLAGVIQDLANGQASDELLMAACLLRYRIDPEIGMSEVMALHPDIISGLAALYRDEDNKVIERLAIDEAKESVSLEKVAKKLSPRGVAKT
jgi:hypothetical protein